MKLSSIALLLAKFALPALIGLLLAYRQYLAQRSARGRKDEVPFPRQYERIEPKSEHPDYVREASDFILHYHEWVKLAVLVGMIAIGIAFMKEPLVRITLGFTAIVLVAIVMVWAYRRRSSRRLGMADETAGLSDRGHR